jgi:alpha-glucosidase (family GH31 glycosyl hydrolase)
MGMSFWWIDWQQGGAEGGCTGLAQNPTIWLNKLRATDHIRRNENVRALILSRWGGLGNHRYQVGFSGDVQDLSWQSLAFQPYFSFTASNVGYGFWSHDIVGPYNNHELHTRWIQWAAYSGVFRTHDRGMSSGSCANNNPQTCAIVKVC